MSKSLHSPTARLLQSSRLFSLPRPLPSPALDNASAAGQYRNSDSATLPYPIYQAITTPAPAQFRGDWGLKRSIPKKKLLATTHSNTSVIRVGAQDTWEHITDFESAGDHVQTERKWRQLGIPLVIKEPRSTYSNERGAPQSVYDEDVDNTDRDSKAKQRWKYDGPWIPGMDEGEFEDYITRRLSKRKAEFAKFVMTRILERRIHDEERRNREMGLSPTLKSKRISELHKEVKANYETEVKKMRDDHVVQNLGSEMTAAICDFLDLPGIRMTGATSSAKTAGLRSIVADVVSDAGPPSTHPGAGLSHIRSNAFMENHPYWGPQAHRTPVKARADRMTHVLDENLSGGNKIWVQPETASIDENGRIQLQVSRGDKEAIAVKKNEVEQIHAARSASFTGAGYVPRPGPGEAANYGYSLPDTRPQQIRQPRSRVGGFDAELGRAPQQGPMGAEDATAKIKELLYRVSGKR
ncbi:uncharacterized protein MYCFIDRAFT_143415 [Pseudocercospora fijiensis CIRAD86]|uniref:Uncharacterized protein n=1 Tax=Pseudocercospora fijiensis (strain CIRAD86) TaxID=383855 RepID=M3AQG2_PSEFD|nr:uncharacterized protein MYCFIDRAFT_143415 [Pseudocercospora fijiensis CIRAD86]EME79667.1 hypothetical protein MYCFIDRAFT_143415 [Pseudocercospora fijiensis CIRAD86]